MRTAHRITLHVNVENRAALWAHAFSIATNPAGRNMDASDARELLGTNRRPDVGACLRMAFDHGNNPPGAEIIDSDHEGGEGLD